MPGPRLLLGALALAASLVAGCDSGDADPQPLDARPPQVSDFTFSPDSVFFDDAIASEDMADVNLALAVRADDPDGEIARVEYAVRWQFAPTGEPSVTGTLEPDGDGRYTGNVGLTLPRNRRGLYTVIVYAVDNDGLLSNQVRGLFELAGFGLGPPSIDEIDAPEEFRPPGMLTLIAVVSDPDGLENVARVEVSAPAGGVFELSDDGQTFGDDEADDGRYTASFDVPEAQPGPQTFVFRAFDRDGLVSADVPFTITILE